MLWSRGVYEELLKPFGGKLPKRIKTAVAAAAELGDAQVGVGTMAVPVSTSFWEIRWVADAGVGALAEGAAVESQRGLG